MVGSERCGSAHWRAKRLPIALRTFHVSVRPRGLCWPGTIPFGEGHSFEFSSIGEGLIGSSPAAGVSHGAVNWKIEQGRGQFAGASGIITSNFILSEQGEATDCHFGVIWLA